VDNALNLRKMNVTIFAKYRIFFLRFRAFFVSKAEQENNGNR